MKDSNSDLFDPVVVMESDWSRGGASTSDANFAFTFNDSNFSDRVLRIEIVADASPDSNAAACATIVDWARHRKRRREYIKKDNNGAVDVASVPNEQIFNRHQSEGDDCENQDEKVVAMAEEPHSGDEATNSNDSDWSMDCAASAVVRVKTLHINSPILAAKSPLFYKLFSNGIRESEQRHVTLRIDASEEAALMEC